MSRRAAHLGQLRLPLTIEAIGRRRFWAGIVAGLGTGLLLYGFLLSAFTAEARTVAGFGYGTYSAGPAHSLARFLAAFGAVQSLAVALAVWCSPRPGAPGHRARQTVRANALLVLWFWSLALAELTARFLGVLTGPDRFVGLLQSEPGLVYGLAPVLFLQLWLPLRLRFRCGRWMLAAALGVSVWAVVLYLVTPAALLRGG